jgi:hypothetical protein
MPTKKLLIEIEEPLHRLIKTRAAQEGKLMKDLVRELLAESVKGGKQN